MHKEKIRLVLKHVAVKGDDFDAIRPQCRMTGFTSLATRTKSPVIAAFPPSVGWKLIAWATPIELGMDGPPINESDPTGWNAVGLARGMLN